MANARKLPSGAWQTRPTKVINGKKISKSFTVHPDQCGGNSKKAKALSEMKANEWQFESKQNEIFGPTVKQAMESYIEDRKKVLSPRSIYDYNRLIPRFESIWNICISDIESAQIQALINEWAIDLGKKTITNRIGFLMSVLQFAGCDKRFKFRYPQKTTKDVVSPDVQDVQKLLANAPDDFRPVICLAAFGSLRRGEISALKQKDISRDMNTIYVHADIVQTEDGLKYKDIPKTVGSVRTIQLPKSIIDMLPTSDDPESFVFPFNPNMITSRYNVIRKRCGVESSFHSLRHFAASFRSDLNIPRKYIEEVGGWKDDSVVLQRVYDNTLASTRKKYTQIANRYIEDTFMENFKTS